MNWKPVLGWMRGISSAALSGGADGLLIALGGSGAVSALNNVPVSPKAILDIMLVNILLDTARFIKANPDPMGFVGPIASSIPPTPEPKVDKSAALPP